MRSFLWWKGARVGGLELDAPRAEFVPLLEVLIGQHHLRLGIVMPPKGSVIELSTGLRIRASLAEGVNFAGQDVRVERDGDLYLLRSEALNVRIDIDGEVRFTLESSGLLAEGRLTLARSPQQEFILHSLDVRGRLPLKEGVGHIRLHLPEHVGHSAIDWRKLLDD